MSKTILYKSFVVDFGVHTP